MSISPQPTGVESFPLALPVDTPEPGGPEIRPVPAPAGERLGAISTRRRPAERLFDRIHATLGATTVRGGGLAAAALRDLAEADILLGGARIAAGRWDLLTDNDLRRLAAGLAKLLDGDEGASLMLPSGREVSADMYPGVISIDSVMLGIDVDRPGLHPFEDLPEFAGSNFDLLMSHIEELSSDRPCRGLGVPRKVTIENRVVEHFLQWKPHTRMMGVIPQYSAIYCNPLCTSLSSEIVSLAERIVEQLQWFWDRIPITAFQAQLLREAGDRIAARHDDVRLSDVVYDIALCETRLQFTAWDAAYRRGLVASMIPWKHGDDVIRKHYGPIFPEPASDVREVHAAGAEGRIDGVARSIVEAAAEGREAVLLRLADAYETCVTVLTSVGWLRYRLFWQIGVVRVESIGGAPFTVFGSDLRFPQTVPLSLAIASTGQSLGRLVGMPFPCDVRIQAVDVTNCRTAVTVEEELWLVNCSQGRIWR